MNLKISSILIIGLLMFAGCDDVHAPHAIPSDKFPAGAYPKNVAVEWTLKDALVAGPTIVKDGSKDQPLSVSQPMRNIRDYPIEVQYQFTFLDSTGRPIQPNSGWRNITLEGRVERFLESTALDTNAVDWRLTVRPAK